MHVTYTWIHMSHVYITCMSHVHEYACHMNITNVSYVHQYACYMNTTCMSQHVHQCVRHMNHTCILQSITKSKSICLWCTSNAYDMSHVHWKYTTCMSHVHHMHVTLWTNVQETMSILWWTPGWENVLYFFYPQERLWRMYNLEVDTVTQVTVINALCVFSHISKRNPEIDPQIGAYCMFSFYAPADMTD